MTQDSGIDLGNCLGNFELVNNEVPDPDSDVLFHLKILHVSPSFNSMSLRKSLMTSYPFWDVSWSTKAYRLKYFLIT